MPAPVINVWLWTEGAAPPVVAVTSYTNHQQLRAWRARGFVFFLLEMLRRVYG